MSRLDATDEARPVADQSDPPPSPPPGRRRWTPRQRTLLAIAVLALAFLVPLRGLLRMQGPPMEEGFMLVFPELVLEGKLPNQDFLHLYGPGSLWVLAGIYEVFGTSLLVERLVGLTQQVALVGAVFALARPWGRSMATLCALVTLFLIISPISLTALAWVGAIALGLWSVKVGLSARYAEDATQAKRLALVAGLLAGLALLYRPDLVIAVALAGVALAWGLERDRRRALLLGLAIGVAPFLIHVATVGVGDAVQGMVIDPVFNLREGRRLPLPPPVDELQGFLQRAGDTASFAWRLPDLRTPVQLTVWFFALLAATIGNVVVAARAVRRRPGERRPRILLVASLFAAGLLPQAVQRSDSAHLSWVSCIAFALVPLALDELVRDRPSWTVRRRALAFGGGMLAFLVLAIPVFTARPYVDLTNQTFNRHRLAHAIRHDGRLFYYGRADVARALPDLFDDLERVSEPGDRLFVGPSDLRKTPYSDAFLYYLFPELEPATYYIEMDPGVANAEDSGLAEEVASSDVVILSAVWDDWNEPNGSRDFGPDEPNQVLREQFCRVGIYEDGLYELLRRCDSS